MKCSLRVCKYFILIVFVLFLMGCGKNKTAHYFLTHPEDIEATYDRCVSLDSKIKPAQTKECIEVMQAIPVFRAYFLELMNNPEKYGLDIMQAEIKLMKLQKNYQLALQKPEDKILIENLKQAVESQELEIQSRLALMRFIFKIR